MGCYNYSQGLFENQVKLPKNCVLITHLLFQCNSITVPEVVVTVSISVHVNGPEEASEEKIELGGRRRIAATSPVILNIALGERLHVLLTACKDVVVVISSILEPAICNATTTLYLRKISAS